jgi:hypothetical protein
MKIELDQSELEHYFSLQAKAEAYINNLVRHRVAEQITSNGRNND